MAKVTFLVSGGGGNLKFFHTAIRFQIISGLSLSVIADRQCGALDFARRNSIPYCITNYTRDRPDELRDLLNEESADLIITNWHKIIDSTTVSQFSGRLINLHYSLLPAFKGMIGLEPIRRAYLEGVKFIGPTCHLVDDGVDTGQILGQAIFRTDCSIEAAINSMFRMGCLLLLNCVTRSLSTSIINARNNQNPSFSPSLSFSEEPFCDEFWSLIAEE